MKKDEIIELVKSKGVNIKEISFRLSKRKDVLFAYYNGDIIRRVFDNPERPCWTFFLKDDYFYDGTSLNEITAVVMENDIRRYKEEQK